MKKKSGIFLPQLQKNRALLDFFRNLVSRFSLILTKIWCSIECKWFYGASPNINRFVAVFSPQPLKNWDFFGFFRQSGTHRKSQNVKMRNFCNGF